jgi:hypothetical protein
VHEAPSVGFTVLGPALTRRHPANVLRRLSRAGLVTGVLSIVLIGLPSAAGAVPIPWRNCGTAGDLITISRADSSLWPPVAGQPITLNFQFVLRQSIKGGYARLRVAGPPPRDHRPMWPLEIPLGPANLGPYSRSVTLMVPTGAGGKVFNVTFDAYDTRGDQLICVQASVPFKGATTTSVPRRHEIGPPTPFLWTFFDTFLPTPNRP